MSLLDAMLRMNGFYFALWWRIMSNIELCNTNHTDYLIGKPGERAYLMI